eukprot:CAMPEP_0175398976 /NCGR_PEP_ID=MMETSP0095-20121207/35762_1 /TAXON_ID=311494 /ORGANISM="Alexandrium monilatum, Strain CCMP3105" /LENGTH=168 /DNA_ID=CAMNT_0016697695 /DNA_START=64 /DNA_END=568 /DNA_ORIENTATION=+
MIPSTSGDVPRSALLQKIMAVLLDNVWQLTCVGGALFAFYEDRVLCACGVAGFAGLFCSIFALERAGFVPTRGERLWSIVIPVCGALAVVTSVSCRLAGWILAPWLVCVGLFAATTAISMFTVRGDKDAASGCEGRAVGSGPDTAEAAGHAALAPPSDSAAVLCSRAC